MLYSHHSHLLIQAYAQANGTSDNSVRENTKFLIEHCIYMRQVLLLLNN